MEEEAAAVAVAVLEGSYSCYYDGSQRIRCTYKKLPGHVQTSNSGKTQRSIKAVIVDQPGAVRLHHMRYPTVNFYKLEMPWLPYVHAGQLSLEKAALSHH